MRAETHLWMFRCLLLMVLVVPALNCTEEGGGGCDCDCLDVPEDDDDSTDDDDSAVGSDDDDSTDDDDSSADDDDDVVDVTGDLPACEGSVLAAFTEDEIQPPGPASDGYLIPSEDTIEAVVASVEALTSGNAALALAEVAVVGYELCGGAGDEAGTALWRPVEPGSGRAVIAWLRDHGAEHVLALAGGAQPVRRARRLQGHPDERRGVAHQERPRQRDRRVHRRLTLVERVEHVVERRGEDLVGARAPV